MRNFDRRGDKKEKTVYYRAVTTVIFFASLLMCVYQTYQLILLYVSDPIETQIKVIMHDAMKFPAVTICNLNPVRRSRWQKKMNQTGYPKEPEISPWKKKSSRKTRSSILSNTEQSKLKPGNGIANVKENFKSSSEESRKRLKRQVFIIGSKLTEGINVTKERLDIMEASMSAIWTNLTENYERQMELEGIVDELERRLRVTELTTSEIAEEMARARSYLDNLKANMSLTTTENESRNDTTINATTDDGRKKLPPGKDLQAFQNYLREIGKISRRDFQELGNQKEDFIASCTWQGTICDPSHFEEFQNFMYGNCFTFNTSKIGSRVSGTGPYNGLSLSLFIEQDEYMDRIASAAGARVVVHDFHFQPLPDEEGFSVPPGYTTAISLQKSTTETVKPICDPDIETSANNGEKYLYSQRGCLKKCLSDEIIRKCHCAGMQFFLNMRTCSVDNNNEVECVEELESLARKNKLPCHCPLKCRTTAYVPIISSAIWPAEKYLPSLLEELVRVRHRVLDLFDNITDFNQYFRKNFLRINIFFQELKEQEALQRHSYGIASLLSDIGGQLGLWVGVSVLTLVDFTENVSMFVMTLYRRIRARFVRKSRRLSIADGPLRPSLDVPNAIDAEGSCILSPSSSAVRSHGNLGLAVTASGLGTKLPHAHFKKPSTSSKYMK